MRRPGTGTLISCKLCTARRSNGVVANKPLYGLKRWISEGWLRLRYPSRHYLGVLKTGPPKQREVSEEFADT
jgi:hypothetical protein